AGRLRRRAAAPCQPAGPCRHPRAHLEEARSMSTTRTPTPASIAPVIGTHLARAHRTTQHLPPAPVVLWAARQTGTYAWTLVHHRAPATTPAVLLSHTPLAPTSPEVVAQTLAGL